MIKCCNKCKIDKDVSEFYIKKGRTGLAGYSGSCKECMKITKLQYYEDNKNIISVKAKKYYEDNKSIISVKTKKYKDDNKYYYSEYNKLYRANNKEKLNEYIQNWRDDNKEQIKLKRCIYYQENKDEIISKVYKYSKNRLKIDPLYKLTRGIRALISISFRNRYTNKSKKTIEILGCSFGEFKIHLENQFDENMNWGNQGSYWEMDHIKPVSSATNEEELYLLNHYTNFQPLYYIR